MHFIDLVGRERSSSSIKVTEIRLLCAFSVLAEGCR